MSNVANVSHTKRILFRENEIHAPEISSRVAIYVMDLNFFQKTIFFLITKTVLEPAA